MRRASTVISLMTLLVAGLSAQEVIDRLMATVNGQVITLSDVRAALALGVVESQPPDVEGAATRQLIDRTLILQEVARFSPPEPTADAIDAHIGRMKERFRTAAEFEAMAAATGLEPLRLRDLARDDLRIQSYLTQRFGASGTPTEEEVARYYRTHHDEFTRDGVLQPFEAVATLVRDRAAAQRRRDLITDWVASLHTRADIQELYRNP